MGHIVKVLIGERDGVEFRTPNEYILRADEIPYGDTSDPTIKDKIPRKYRVETPLEIEDGESYTVNLKLINLSTITNNGILGVI